MLGGVGDGGVGWEMIIVSLFAAATVTPIKLTNLSKQSNSIDYISSLFSLFFIGRSVAMFKILDSPEHHEEVRNDFKVVLS